MFTLWFFFFDFKNIFANMSRLKTFLKRNRIIKLLYIPEGGALHMIVS